MYSNFKPLPDKQAIREQDAELSDRLCVFGLRMNITSAAGLHGSAAGYDSAMLKLVHTTLEQHDTKQQPHHVNLFVVTGQPKAIDEVLKLLHQFYTERGYTPAEATLVL